MKVGELRQALRLLPDDYDIIMCTNNDEIEFRDVCYFDEGHAGINLQGEIIYHVYDEPYNSICIWPDDPGRVE